MAKFTVRSKDSCSVSAAVIIDRKGLIHSVMVSRNSLWSAVMRCRALNRKLKERRWYTEQISVHLNVGVMEEMVTAIKAKKQLADLRAIKPTLAHLYLS